MRRLLPVLAILAVALIVWLPTLGWGLPSRDADRYLFGDRTPWTGKEILALTATTQPTTARGADVDADPILDRSKPVILNDTDAKRAAIVRRYRLMSGQPDEFIQFKALSEMAGRSGVQKLDPRLYQYGGLWMYPVGAMVRAAMLVGIIQSPPPGVPALEFYLDHPEAFGRFYVVARFYSWCWGIVAALAIVWLARRITNSASLATLAAVAFMLTPVVRAATHEAKPHLAGAALCLCAVIAATRYVETGRRRYALGAGALCGAAMGMVVSMLLSIVALPTMVLLRRRATRDGATKPTPAESLPDERRAPFEPTAQRSAWTMLVASLACAAFVYCATNPFVIYNAIAQPEILRSNLGNSTAMYSPRSDGIHAVQDALRIFATGLSGEGFVVACIGVFVAALTAVRRSRVPSTAALLVGVPALAFLAMFMLLAAGKPAEYARFSLFLTAAVAIVAGAAIDGARPRERILMAAVCATVLFPLQFVTFVPRDSIDGAGLHRLLASRPDRRSIELEWEPAPWSMPPCDLFANDLSLTQLAVDQKEDEKLGVFPANLASQIGGNAFIYERVDWRDNRFATLPSTASLRLNSDSGPPGYPPASRTAPASRGR